MKKNNKAIEAKSAMAKDAPKAQIDVSPNKEKKIGYAEFKALIEAYKVQNPVKYEAKKESLEKQLKSLE